MRSAVNAAVTAALSLLIHEPKHRRRSDMNISGGFTQKKINKEPRIEKIDDIRFDLRRNLYNVLFRAERKRRDQIGIGTTRVYHATRNRRSTSEIRRRTSIRRTKLFLTRNMGPPYYENP